MALVKIIDKLVDVAKARADKSPEGTGFARTKNQSVRYTKDHLLPGMDHIESVRFIESPMLEDSDDD